MSQRTRTPRKNLTPKKYIKKRSTEISDPSDFTSEKTRNDIILDECIDKDEDSQQRSKNEQDVLESAECISDKQSESATTITKFERTVVCQKERRRLFEVDDDQSALYIDDGEIEDLPNEENDFDRELEKKKDSQSIRLTVRNVKSLIKEVITNEHARDMVRSILKKEGLTNQAKEAIFEPKMTRSKVKEQLRNGKVPSSWPLSPIKPGGQLKEVPIVEMSFNEDEDDEDYNPNVNEDHEQEDSADDTDSVFSSQLSEMGSPRGLHPCSASSTPQLSRVTALRSVSTPQHAMNVSGNSDIECEQENIALRTRSKLPLTDTRLDELEADFIAPDISADMYDTSINDNEWTTFLSMLQKDVPLTELNDSRVDEEENDPEYDILAALENEQLDHDDLKEDLRDDKAVKVSKKELNELMDELFDVYGDMPAVEESEDNETPLRVDPTVEALLSMNKFFPPVEASPSTSTNHVEITTEQMENVAKESNNGALGEISTDVANKQECDAAVSIKQGRGLRHLYLEKPMEKDVETEVKLRMTDSEVKQLEDHMRKHVQLLAQSYVLSYDDPDFEETSTHCTKLLKELQEFGENSTAEHSHFHPVNLTSALNVTQFVANEESLEIARAIRKDQERKNYKGSGYTKLFPLTEEQMGLFSSRPVFCFPSILPEGRFFPTKVNRRRECLFTEWEDNLIALGCNQFHHLSSAKLPYLIHSYVMPTKTANNIRNRIKNLRSTKYGDNPVSHFFLTGKLRSFGRIPDLENPGLIAPASRNPLGAAPAWLTQFLQRKTAEVKPEEKRSSKRRLSSPKGDSKKRKTSSGLKASSQPGPPMQPTMITVDSSQTQQVAMLPVDNGSGTVVMMPVIIQLGPSGPTSDGFQVGGATSDAISTSGHDAPSSHTTSIMTNAMPSATQPPNIITMSGDSNMATLSSDGVIIEEANLVSMENTVGVTKNSQASVQSIGVAINTRTSNTLTTSPPTLVSGCSTAVVSTQPLSDDVNGAFSATLTSPTSQSAFSSALAGEAQTQVVYDAAEFENLDLTSQLNASSTASACSSTVANIVLSSSTEQLLNKELGINQPSVDFDGIVAEVTETNHAEAFTPIVHDTFDEATSTAELLPEASSTCSAVQTLTIHGSVHGSSQSAWSKTSTPSSVHAANTGRPTKQKVKKTLFAVDDSVDSSPNVHCGLGEGDVDSTCNMRASSQTSGPKECASVQVLPSDTDTLTSAVATSITTGGPPVTPGSSTHQYPSAIRKTSPPSFLSGAGDGDVVTDLSLVANDDDDAWSIAERSFRSGGTSDMSRDGWSSNLNTPATTPSKGVLHTPGKSPFKANKRYGISPFKSPFRTPRKSPFKSPLSGHRRLLSKTPLKSPRHSPARNCFPRVPGSAAVQLLTKITEALHQQIPAARTTVDDAIKSDAQTVPKAAEGNNILEVSKAGVETHLRSEVDSNAQKSKVSDAAVEEVAKKTSSPDEVEANVSDCNDEGSCQNPTEDIAGHKDDQISKETQKACKGKASVDEGLATMLSTSNEEVGEKKEEGSNSSIKTQNKSNEKLSITQEISPINRSDPTTAENESINILILADASTKAKTQGNVNVLANSSDSEGECVNSGKTVPIHSTPMLPAIRPKPVAVCASPSNLQLPQNSHPARNESPPWKMTSPNRRKTKALHTKNAVKKSVAIQPKPTIIVPPIDPPLNRLLLPKPPASKHQQVLAPHVATYKASAILVDEPYTSASNDVIRDHADSEIEQDEEKKPDLSDSGESGKESDADETSRPRGERPKKRRIRKTAAQKNINYDFENGLLGPETLGIGSKPESKAQKSKKSSTNRLVESDPKRDQRDTLFARAYLKRVKSEVPALYFPFLKQLRSFVIHQKNPIQIYNAVQELFCKQPLLADDFAVFLSKQQAIKAGCLATWTQYHRARELLRKMEVTLPRSTRTVLYKSMRGTCASDERKESLLKVMKDLELTILRDDFMAFEQGKLREAHKNEASLEHVNLVNKNQNYLTHDIIRLNKGTENASVTCRCNLEKQNLTGCDRCKYKIIDGKVYARDAVRGYQPYYVASQERASHITKTSCIPDQSTSCAPTKKISVDASPLLLPNASSTSDQSKSPPKNEAKSTDFSATRHLRFTQPPDSPPESHGMPTLQCSSRSLTPPTTTHLLNVMSPIDTGPHSPSSVFTSPLPKKLEPSPIPAEVIEDAHLLCDASRRSFMTSPAERPVTSPVSNLAGPSPIPADLTEESNVVGGKCKESGRTDFGGLTFQFQADKAKSFQQDNKTTCAQKLPAESETTSSSAWTIDEDRIILKWCEELGTTPLAYSRIRGTLKDRSISEVKSRVHWLSSKMEEEFPEQSKAQKWTVDEDRLLLSACQTRGTSDDVLKFVALQLESKTYSEVKTRLENLLQFMTENNSSDD